MLKALFLLVHTVLASFGGSIQSLASYKCLDLPGGDTTNGNIIWQWTCAGTFNQQWNFDGYGQITVASDPSKCIDAGDIYGNGIQLFVWDCNGYPNQAWYYDDNYNTIVLANTEKCMDLTNGVFDNEGGIQSWDCTSYDNQQWVYEAPAPSPQPTPPPSPSVGAGTIVNTETSLCIDLPGGDPSNGNQLWLWGCANSESQMWRFQDGSIVYDANPNVCMDVYAGDYYNGASVEVWECQGGPQQMFGYDSDALSIYLSGSETDSTKCLQIRDASGMPGTVLEIWSCLPYGTQKWQLGGRLSADVSV